MTDEVPQTDQFEVLKAEGFYPVGTIIHFFTDEARGVVTGSGPQVWAQNDHIDPRSEEGERVFKAVFGNENVRRVPYNVPGGKELTDIVVRHDLGNLNRGFTQDQIHGLANFMMLFAREYHEPGSVTAEDRARARETWERIAHPPIK